MKTYSATLLLSLFSFCLIAQNSSDPKRVSDQSPTFDLRSLNVDCHSLQDDKNPFPIGEVIYVGDGNNSVLEPLEPFTFKFEVINDGDGRATCLEVYVEDSKSSNSRRQVINTGRHQKISKIDPGAREVVELKITPGVELEDGDRTITIFVKENGKRYDMPPLDYVIKSRAYSPDLQYRGFVINKEPTRSTNNRIEKNEEVNLGLIIQNSSNSRAFAPNYRLLSNDENVLIYKGKYDNSKGRQVRGGLKTLAAYEVDTIQFNLRVTGAYREDVRLPIRMQVTDSLYSVPGLASRIKTSIIDMALDVDLDAKPKAPHVVKGEDAKRDIGGNFSDRWRKKKDELEIAKYPEAVSINPNAAALIIGIEDYYPLSDAPYAAQDAKIMEEYMHRALGVSKDRIMVATDKEANSGFFLRYLKDLNQLRNTILDIDEDTDLYVYYSGHGIPAKEDESTETDKVYLFPSDGTVSNLKGFGIELDDFYSGLVALNTRSVTVFMDACFSGSSRGSSAYETQNLTDEKFGGARFINPEFKGNWQNNKNFMIFTSSSFGETSLGNDITGTGLFTYYLAAGLKGNADRNKDARITSAELINYLKNNVSSDAEKLYQDGKQTPTFIGSDFNKVLVDRN